MDRDVDVLRGGLFVSVVLSDEAIIERLQGLCNDGCEIDIRSSPDSTWAVRIDYPPGHEAGGGRHPLGSFVLVDELGLRAVLLQAFMATPTSIGREAVEA
jgi:hypothetical protein